MSDQTRVLPLAYLDQWLWIRIARAANGYADASDTVPLLNRLRELVDAGLIHCPLSNIHYMETQAHHVQARRIRLGKVMVELSKLRTLAPSHVVVPWELDRAIARRFHRARTLPELSVLGFGVGHAVGRDLIVPVGRLFSESPQEWANRKVQAQYLFEVGALTGTRGDAPMEEFQRHYDISMRYAEGERTLAEKMKVAGIAGTSRDDMILVGELVDLMKPLEERMNAAQLTWPEFLSAGRQGLAEFLEEMPSRSVALAIRRQRHANTEERWKEGDLHDIAAMSVAVAYCNVVAVEKHAHSVLTKSRIAERFGTVVVRRPSDLCAALDSIVVRL